jgi:hypothetical protein
MTVRDEIADVIFKEFKHLDDPAVIGYISRIAADAILAKEVEGKKSIAMCHMPEQGKIFSECDSFPECCHPDDFVPDKTWICKDVVTTRPATIADLVEVKG